MPKVAITMMPLAFVLAAGCQPHDKGAQVQAAVRKCGLEGQLTVELRQNRDLHIVRLDPNTPYQKMDCFLEEVRPLGLNLGFVGNEQPAQQ